MNFEKCNCILPWDTNNTLKATFKFLKEYQGLYGEIDSNTRLYLGIASLEWLNLDNYKERNQAVNFIYGKIVDILDYAVVIESPFECKSAIYIVAYSEIESLQNDVLLKYKEEYLEYMEELPALCKSEENSYYAILRDLKCEVNKNKCNQNLEFVVMYGGIFSQAYRASDIDVVKNLICIVNGIIPVTQVMGYFTTIETKEKIEEEK